MDVFKIGILNNFMCKQMPPVLIFILSRQVNWTQRDVIRSSGDSDYELNDASLNHSSLNQILVKLCVKLDGSF